MLPGMIWHDIITKMSVLVGNPCVCQLCIGWRYHQTVSKLTSFSQYGRASTFWIVLVIKNDSGRAPFSRGNYISHHRPSTNVDSMAFPQTCQIARVRGRPKRVPRSISKCNFVRRKTYVSSFRRWKPALPTMKPWRFLGYAEMNSFSIGFPGPR